MKNNKRPDVPIYQPLFYFFVVNEEAGESWRYNLRVCNFFYILLTCYRYLNSHYL